jgi:transposase
VTSIAAVSSINVQSVFRWLADFGDGGQNALLPRPIPGRPPKVSVEDVPWLAKAARDNTGLQFKFALDLWVMSLIEREFGMKSSPASLGGS